MDIDKLLADKKNQKGNFSKSVDEFSKEFFAKIENTPPNRAKGLLKNKGSFFTVTKYFALAASILIFLGIATFFGAKYTSNYDKAGIKQYNKLIESVRLFGDDVAVLFIGNELVTGSRESNTIPNNFIELDMTTWGEKFKLSLACSDEDSIIVDSLFCTGTIVTSKSDNKTLLLDIELNHDGKSIRTIIPVAVSQKNNYITGDV